MDLLSDLRAATRDAHDRIERLPSAQAMAGGRIGRDEYVAVLGRLYWAHATFEAAVTRSPDLAAAWPAEAVRAAAAARDLRALGSAPTDCPPEAVLAWADGLDGAGRPAAWAGAGYVLEGSRLGGRVLAGPLAAALDVPPGPGRGLDYHREGLDDPGGRWARVRAALVAVDATPADRDALVAGAVATFALMAALHAVPAAPTPRSAGRVP